MLWLVWEGWVRAWWERRYPKDSLIKNWKVDGGIRQRMSNLRRKTTPHS